MSYSMPELIGTKRDGGVLTAEELEWIIAEYTADQIPDYQLSAFLMAIVFRGLNDDELSAWTDAMLHSGDVLDLSATSMPKVDKHSTGGVGDKISIPLAPLVTACGVAIPMMSGRGLGHTGGTLDKLETIPGFKTRLDPDVFTRQLDELGLVLAGQSETLVPADRRIYALRDASGTVPAIPLIASSIMSKKLAEDLDGLVLDVKIGSGAFMKDVESGTELAETMVGIGRSHDTPVVGFLTDMDQPLGTEVGNANEMAESIAILRGEGPPDSTELTFRLGEEMLILGGVAADRVGGQSAAAGSGRVRFRSRVSSRRSSRHKAGTQACSKIRRSCRPQRARTRSSPTGPVSSNGVTRWRWDAPLCGSVPVARRRKMTSIQASESPSTRRLAMPSRSVMPSQPCDTTRTLQLSACLPVLEPAWVIADEAPAVPSLDSWRGEMSYEDLQAAAAAIAERTGRAHHDAAVVLGSGLSSYASSFDDAIEIPYADIPHFPEPRVVGHGGSLFSAPVGDGAVLLFAGRVHTYEGWPLDEVVFGVRTAALAGARSVLLTNAAGGLGEGLAPGDLVAIRDHLNYTARNPLVGVERRSTRTAVPRHERGVLTPSPQHHEACI